MNIRMWNIPEGRKRQLLWWRSEVNNREEIDNIIRRFNGKNDIYCTISHYSKVLKDKPKTFIDGIFTSVLNDIDGLPLDKRFKKLIENKIKKDGYVDSKEYNKIIDNAIILKKYLAYNDMNRLHKYFENRSLLHTVYFTGRFFHIHLINSIKGLKYPNECLYNIQSYFDMKVREQYNKGKIIDEIKKKGYNDYWLDTLINPLIYEDVKLKTIEGKSIYIGSDRQLFGDISRHGRIEFTIHPKSKLYCNPLTHDQIHSSYDEIAKICKSKNICDNKDFFIGNKTLNPVIFDKMKVVSKYDGFSNGKVKDNEMFTSSEEDLMKLMSEFSGNTFVTLLKSITPVCFWRVFDSEPEHALRWQLTRYLYEVGYSSKDIKFMFKKFNGIWVDYDEQRTNYQIDTICNTAKSGGSEIRSCRSMKVLGLCISGCNGFDDLTFPEKMISIKTKEQRNENFNFLLNKKV